MKEWINPAHIVKVKLEEDQFWLTLNVYLSNGDVECINSFMINRENGPDERDKANKAYREYLEELSAGMYLAKKEVL